MVRDSSTVMTPSLPTFFIAAAMMVPICESELAEMVPTCAIMSPVTGLENSESAPPVTTPFSSRLPMMASTALSMPRLSAIGLAPAATVLTPSR
jgi:hypothetical protein